MPCASIEENSIFTNVALTDDGDVWWEGMTENASCSFDRLARTRSWTPDSMKKQRILMRDSLLQSSQCPVIDPAWEDPKGVPISALFLAEDDLQWFRWSMRSLIGSMEHLSGLAFLRKRLLRLQEKWANYDTIHLQCLPFCGYNMGDYFAHWLSIGQMRILKNCLESTMSIGLEKGLTGNGFGQDLARTAEFWNGCLNAQQDVRKRKKQQ